LVTYWQNYKVPAGGENYLGLFEKNLGAAGHPTNRPGAREGKSPGTRQPDKGEGPEKARDRKKGRYGGSSFYGRN